MSTVSRTIPARPHIDVPKRQARELLAAWRRRAPDALDRIRRHPAFHEKDDQAIAAGPFRLADAQLIVAREYGLAHWPQLKARIEAYALAGQLDDGIAAGDVETVVHVLRQHPDLLHVPVWSGNWGPPMSHAANLGKLEIIEAVAALGARDFQHAFDRAVLQGQLACARWLHEHGARLVPGIVMGACETLNAEGLAFLADLGAPFTDHHGSRLAPLAMVLETYGRHPEGKHKVLEIFAQQGYELPDTPIVAFHRGDTTRLAEHLRRDPQLLERRFALRDIYPPALGCADDDRSGLHGTPLGGTTLLHMAIDFDEHGIFELLIASGADVNARAAIDAEGYGGHTPLFHVVVPGAAARRRDVRMARRLLDAGASPAIRATLRKYLDWRETPGWHDAHDVTAVEWAVSFPEEGWVNRDAMRLIDPATDPPC